MGNNVAETVENEAFCFAVNPVRIEEQTIVFIDHDVSSHIVVVGAGTKKAISPDGEVHVGGVEIFDGEI